MTPVAVITTAVVVCCCFGLSYELGSCESCGRECKDVCGTKQFRPCCFNYLKKRTVDRESTNTHDNVLCQQCGKKCSLLCNTKLFVPCCYYEEKRKGCKFCGSECQDACGTKYFRTCCLNYNKKRSIDNPIPLEMVMAEEEGEEYNNEHLEEASSQALHIHPFYEDVKTGKDNED